VLLKNIVIITTVIIQLLTVRIVYSECNVPYPFLVVTFLSMVKDDGSRVNRSQEVAEFESFLKQNGITILSSKYIRYVGEKEIYGADFWIATSYKLIIAKYVEAHPYPMEWEFAHRKYYMDRTLRLGECLFSRQCEFQCKDIVEGSTKIIGEINDGTNTSGTLIGAKGNKNKMEDRGNKIKNIIRRHPNPEDRILSNGTNSTGGNRIGRGSVLDQNSMSLKTISVRSKKYPQNLCINF
jgi:hypothetical protein